MSRTGDLIAEARVNAAGGLGIVEIMEKILEGLGSEFSTFRFIFILHRAFGVPPRNLKDLTSWDRLGTGGQLTTDCAVDLVRAWLTGAGAVDERDLNRSGESGDSMSGETLTSPLHREGRGVISAVQPADHGGGVAPHVGVDDSLDEDVRGGVGRMSAKIATVAAEMREAGASWPDILKELHRLGSSRLDLVRTVRDVDHVRTGEATRIVNESGVVPFAEFAVTIDENDPFYERLFGDDCQEQPDEVR